MLEVNIDEEEQRIYTYLTTIDSISEERSSRASKFILENIIDPDEPITYKLAANYLKWVLGKGDPREETLKLCRCTAGWTEKEDGSVYPCKKCRSKSYMTFGKLIDESGPPR